MNYNFSIHSCLKNGAAFFQILIGSILSSESASPSVFTAEAYRWMFLICLAGAIVSLGAAILLKETIGSWQDQ